MEIDPKLVYWSCALVIMSLVLAFGVAGALEARRKNIAGHKRFMLTAVSLVGLFVVSYVGKVLVLGKEDLDTWSSFARGVLYTHETLILIMLISGGRAGFLAYKRSKTPLEERKLIHAKHRRAGWAAVISGSLAGLAAAIMLGTMFERFILTK